MQGNNSERSRALWARGFAALWAVLVLAVAFSVRPAEAAPFAYVANTNDNTVSVIDTATNLVVGPPIPVGIRPDGVTVTPDGKHVYVTNTGGDPNPGTVSVIDTATNKVVGPPIAVGISPLGIAITPDGKHAYVTNSSISTGGTVLVIDTATNTVGPLIAVGNNPTGVGIVPPPPGVPFLAFSAKLEVDLHRKPNKDRFELQSSFTLSSTAPGIHPLTDPVTLQVESFTTTIPPGSFKKHRDGDEGEDEHEHEDRVFSFHGVIDGVRLKAVIKRTGTLRYAFLAKAKGADLTGTKNAVQVSLIIGNNSGTASVKADIDRDREGGDDD